MTTPEINAAIETHAALRDALAMIRLLQDKRTAAEEGLRLAADEYQKLTEHFGRVLADAGKFHERAEAAEARAITATDAAREADTEIAKLAGACNAMAERWKDESACADDPANAARVLLADWDNPERQALDWAAARDRLDTKADGWQIPRDDAHRLAYALLRALAGDPMPPPVAPNRPIEPTPQADMQGD